MDNTFDRKKEYILVFVSWVFVLILAYIKIWNGSMVLSPSNLMYYMPPWNTMGVGTEGPLLSDSIDSHLPEVYRLFYLNDMSMWDGMNSFGFPTTYNLLLNPINLVYFLPLKYAIFFNSLLKYSIAFFGMYFFMKQIKLHPIAGLVAAVSYSFSSIMVMWHFWPHTDVMMLAPLCFAIGEKLLNNKGIYYVLVQALIVYWMIIAGMPTYAAYVIYLFGFYVLFRTIQLFKKDIKNILITYIKFGVSFVLGVMASLGYLYTLIKMTVLNGYSESRANQGYATIPIKFLRSLFMPYFRDGLEMNATETIVFFGVVVMFFTPFIWIRVTKKRQWFWILSGVIIILFAYTHTLDVVFNIMPGIHTSLKFRVIALIPFVFSINAAVQFSDIIYNIDEYRKKWYRFINYLIVLGAWVAFKMTYPEVMKVIRNIIFVVLIAASLEIIINNKKRVVNNICLIVILAISIINMTSYAREYMPLIDANASVIPEPTDSIKYIQDNLKFRVFAGDGWTLFPRTNVYYGVRSITHHGFINTNSDIEQYLKSMDENIYVTRTNTHGSGISNINLFKYAGVDKVLLTYPIDEQYLDDYEEVYLAQDGLRIYSTDEFNDRFFISSNVKTVDNEDDMLAYMKDSFTKNGVVMLASDYNEEISTIDGDGYISVIEDESDYIKLKVNLDSTKIIVFNEYFDGGWKAIVDDQNTKVIKVNYLFNGIIIPEGEHEIVLKYDTKIQNILFWVTVMIVLSLVSLIVILRFKNWRNKNETDNSDTLL